MLIKLLQNLLGTRASQSPPDAVADPSRLKDAAEAAELRNEPAAATACYRDYLRQRPDDDPAWHHYAMLLAAQGRADMAIDELQSVIAVHPRPFWSLIALGQIERNRSRHAAAIAAYERALALAPEPALAARLLGNLAAAQRASGAAHEALESYRRALASNDEVPEIHYNAALLLCDIGQTDEAARHLECALALQPDFGAAHSALLGLTSMYRRGDPADVCAQHTTWARRYADPLTALAPPHPNVLDANRRLSIGYVSGDFRQHSVCYFIEPILANHDRGAFKVHCYDNAPASDAVNQRLRQYADVWRKIDQLDDEQAAATIRADCIDILVDMSGHTLYNRLMVFARKPAPVQVSWLGYMCTTGMRAMDYRITDAYLDPPGATESLFAETLVRICSAAAFGPAPDSPPVNPLPALQNGYITFGSFNNYSKIGDEVVQTWGRILRRLPGSRLLLVTRNGDNAEEQRRVLGRFERLGAPADAVHVTGRRPMKDFLMMFHGVDIALDPFPCAGGTTSLHTLWMGVPMVSIEGETELARSTTAALRSVGLDHLVAHSIEDYIDRTVALASNTSALCPLRAELRRRMQDTAVLDAFGVARSLEAAYRDMWQRHIEKNCRAAGLDGP